MRLSAFGQAVRAIRMRCDLPLKQMADAMSIGSAHLSAIEFGQKPLDGDLQALAIQFLRPFATSDELAQITARVAAPSAVETREGSL